MAGGVSGWLLQLGQSGGTGTDRNATGNVSVEGIGPVGRTLRDLGLQPGVAKLLGAAISFVIALVVAYALGRAIIVPLFGRALDRRGLDFHEKKPIQRLLKILLFFVALAIAFRAARLSGFFTSIAAIAAAATLAIGLALQDTLSNFVAGAFITPTDPSGSAIGSSGRATAEPTPAWSRTSRSESLGFAPSTTSSSRCRTPC